MEHTRRNAKPYYNIINLLFIILIISCQSGPIRDKPDEVLFDKKYLIFIKNEVLRNGNETFRYELYKIDYSREKFASGTSGITSNTITLENENEFQRDSILKSFKLKYPNSRIYVNNKAFY